jgi:DNA-binding transcriptional ArsR family regulator
MPPARHMARPRSTVGPGPRSAHRPGSGGTALDHLFRSLGDPVRLSIVRQLLACRDEKSCGSFEHEVTKATFSHHLANLAKVGIIRARPDGTRRVISLQLDELERRFPGLLDLIRAVPR